CYEPWRICSEEGFQIIKFNPASACAESSLMDEVIAEFTTEFERMLAAQIRDLIDEVINLIGPDNLGKVVEGAQLREEAAAQPDPDVRNSTQQRIGKTRVDLVG